MIYTEQGEEKLIVATVLIIIHYLANKDDDLLTFFLDRVITSASPTIYC